jgi:hypothetical protein
MRDDAPRFQEAKKYLRQILDSINKRQLLTLDDIDIPKEQISQLISYIFSDENMKYGIPYIMSYFVPLLDHKLESQILNIRYMTGLLHSWHLLEVSDTSF